DRLAGRERGLRAALQQLDGPVGAAHEVATEGARLAAAYSEGAHAAPAGKERAAHRLQEADHAPRAVATAPPAVAARTAADRELLEQHGVSELQDLGVGEPGVGHVHVDGGGAMEAAAVGFEAGGSAGTQRLVVLHT